MLFILVDDIGILLEIVGIVNDFIVDRAEIGESGFADLRSSQPFGAGSSEFISVFILSVLVNEMIVAVKIG